MHWFSWNVFCFGAIISLISYLFILLFHWYCFAFRIRVEQFSHFLSFKFSLHEVKIGSTKFTLGWMPVSSYIKAFGVYEWSDIPEFEQPYALYTKPLYVRRMYSALPYVVPLIIFAVVLLLFTNNGDYLGSMSTLGSYLLAAAEALFSTDAEKEIFRLYSQQLLVGKSLIWFGVMVFLVVSYILATLLSLLNWLILGKDGTIHKYTELLQGAVMVIYWWFLFWKIPAFIFYFFPLSQFVAYACSLLVGMYLVGILLYIITVLVAKWHQKRSPYGSIGSWDYDEV